MALCLSTYYYLQNNGEIEIKKIFIFFITFFIFNSLFLSKNCSGIVLIDYLKHYFFELGRLENTTYQVQFVNEISQSEYCYFTIQDKYFDIYENKILYLTYFPRTTRIIFNQIAILSLIFFLLIDKKKIKNNYESIKFQDLIIFLFGLFISVWLINKTIFNFENNLMLNIFIVFSFFKFLLLYLYLINNKFHIHLLLLSIFPLISTGFGFPWMYDFLIFYVLISLKNKLILKNKMLALVISVLFLSLIFPLSHHPALKNKL